MEEELLLPPPPKKNAVNNSVVDDLLPPPPPKKKEDGGQNSLQPAKPSSESYGFNSEGDSYDYETADKYGIKPDKSGHWQSRAELSKDEARKLGLPEGSGIILKGKRHETFNKTIKGEDEAGYKIIKRGDRYYSVPKYGYNWSDKDMGEQVIATSETTVQPTTTLTPSKEAYQIAETNAANSSKEFSKQAKTFQKSKDEVDGLNDLVSLKATYPQLFFNENVVRIDQIADLDERTGKYVPKDAFEVVDGQVKTKYNEAQIRDFDKRVKNVQKAALDLGGKTPEQIQPVAEQKLNNYQANLTKLKEADKNLKTQLDTLKELNGKQLKDYGITDAFFDGIGETNVSLKVATQAARLDDEELSNELEKIYVGQMITENPEGIKFRAAQMIGSQVIPMSATISTGMLTGGVGGAATAAATYGTMGYGQNMIQGYVQAREQGQLPLEAIRVAKDFAKVGAVTGAAEGIASYINPFMKSGTLVNKTLLKGVKEAVKDAGLDATIAMGSQHANNKYGQNLDLDISDMDGVLGQGVGELAFSLGVNALFGTARLKPAIHKALVYGLAQSDVGSIKMAIDAGVKEGFIDAAKSGQVMGEILEAKKAFDKMPAELNEETKVEIVPDMERKNALEKQLEDKDGSFAPMIEAEIETIDKDIREKIGAPLTERESKEFDKLKAGGTEEKPLSESEKKTLEHYQKRIKQAEKIETDKDKAIEKQQKRLNLPTIPEVLLSDEAESILVKAKVKKVVPTEELRVLTDELYRAYKALRQTKNNPNRRYTQAQIDKKITELEQLIEPLETIKSLQEQSGGLVTIDFNKKYIKTPEEASRLYNSTKKEDGELVTEREGELAAEETAPATETVTPVTDTAVEPVAEAKEVISKPQIKSDAPQTEKTEAEGLLEESNTMPTETQEAPVEEIAADVSGTPLTVEEAEVIDGKKKSTLNRAYEGTEPDEVKAAVEKHGLLYEPESFEAAKSQANGFIDEVGIDNALAAVENGEVGGAPASVIYARAIDEIGARRRASTDETEKAQLLQEETDLIAKWDEHNRRSGQQISILQDLYQTSDFGYSLGKMIERYKSLNKGEISPEMVEKFKEIEAKLDAANKRIAEFEANRANREAQADVDFIKESVAREDKSKPKLRGRQLIAEGLDELTSALGMKLSAVGDQRASTVTALSKIGRGLIDEGLATVNNIATKLREYLQDKVGDKLDFDQYEADVVKDILAKEKAPEMRDGKLHIPEKIIKDFVRSGHTEINDLVKQVHQFVKNILPDVSEREVRDAISGYGKTKSLSKEALAKQLREMRAQLRLTSALEDAENRLRPLKSGFQHEKASAEVKKLKKQVVDAMRKNGLQIGKQELSDTERFATVLEATKNRLKTAIGDYERRIRTGDYNKVKKKPLDLDEEALRLEVEKRKIKEEFDVEAEKARLANRTMSEKVKDFTVDVLNMPKSLLASIDLSAPLRQGAILSISNPKSGAKATKEMFRQLFSEQKANDWLHRLKSTPEYRLMQDAGLYIAEPSAKLTAKEESFMTNLGHKIPLLGKLFRGSERAYAGYLNMLRADVFSKGADRLMEQGLNMRDNKAEFEAWANFVNNATGRGNLGALNASAPLLNAIFFSPRYLASRLNLLNPATYAMMPPAARRMAMDDVLTYIEFGVGILALAAAAGAEVSLDPTETDFGKIKIGDTRYDIWAGFQQIVRTIAQVVMGEANDRKANRLDTLGRFARTKLSPAVGTGVNVLKGKDMLGKEVTAETELMRNVLPLYISDVKNIYDREGVEGIPKVAIPAVVGIGVQSYPAKKKPKIVGLPTLN